MESRVVLTREPIPTSLGKLPFPWNVASGAPGATTGRGRLEGPVGAWLDFYGIVRGTEPADSEGTSGSDGSGTATTTTTTPSGESTIVAIEYEAHPQMAQHQLELLVARIGEAHPLEALLVIHRIGRVPVGEPSLLVRILSGHRGESLRACADLIDELKTWVPIWKHAISS
jgi:hypothetical protein